MSDVTFPPLWCTAEQLAAVDDAALKRGHAQIAEHMAGLYGGDGQPIGKDGLSLLYGKMLALHAHYRPFGRVIGDLNGFTSGAAPLALIWMVPSVPPGSSLPDDAVGRVVEALDAGHPVAIQACDADALNATIAALLALVGGGHA